MKKSQEYRLTALFCILFSTLYELAGKDLDNWCWFAVSIYCLVASCVAIDHESKGEV